MARLLFGGDDVSMRGPYGSAQLNASGRTGIVYADATTSALADIVTYPGGAAIAGSVITVTADSQLPLFQGPADGSDTVWVSVDGGTRTPIYTNVDARLDLLNTVVGTKAATTYVDAQDAATLSSAQTFATGAVGTETSRAMTAEATKLVAGSTATYANLAALPAASAHTNEIVKTLDAAVYESTGSAWVQLVPPTGTYVSLNGTAGFTVESDGGSGQFITANPSVNDIDKTNNAKASAILASGQTGFPNRLGSGCQLCSIPGAYDVDINSGYSSGGTQNPLMNIVDSAHGRITGAGLVSHSRLTGGSYQVAQADAGQSTTYAMLRGTGTGVAVQTLTITATGGTFKLRAGRRVTAAIAFNASAAAIQTALTTALASAPSTTAAVTGTGPFTITLTGNEGFLWADTSLLTGGTATLTIVSVPGPTAYSPGASLIAPVAEGYGTWAAASYSRAVGRQTKSAAQYSYAMGYRTIADLLGAVAHGSGAIAADGDVGVMHLTPFRQTTDGAAHRLCVDGAGGTLVTLLDNTAYAVYLECLAARTDSHSPVQVARFRIEGIVYRQSGVATVVWLPDTTAAFDPQGTGVTLVASADTSGGSISFTATGIAAQTWNWSGYLRLTKAAF